jgi:Protein of unknown function (DUF2857)
MQSNKEADLTTAVLMYAVRCLAEGDQLALRSMQFGPREVDALQQLAISDLYRVDMLRGHCLEVNLNREVFWHLVARLRQERESEELQQRLLKADAPLEMMSVLFGLSSREYTRWRRLLTLAPAVGRPAEAEEDQAHTLWHAWCRRMGDDDEVHLSGEDYLELREATGLGLRIIWSMTQRWTEYGNPEGTPSTGTRANEHAR